MKIQILCSHPNCQDIVYSQGLCWMHFLLKKQKQRNAKSKKIDERRKTKKC